MTSTPGTEAAFQVTLLIIHPDMDPAEITCGLDLVPYSAFHAGHGRVLPNGTKLPGLAVDSRWNHIFRFDKDHVVSDAINEVLSFLEAKRSFMRKLVLRGADVQIYIQFDGRRHTGDTISSSVLARISALRVALSLEVFPNHKAAGKDGSSEEAGKVDVEE